MQASRFTIALLTCMSANTASASSYNTYYTNARLVSCLGLGCIVSTANDTAFQSQEARWSALAAAGTYAAYTALTGYHSNDLRHRTYGIDFNKARYISIAAAGALAYYCSWKRSGGFAATALTLCALHKYLTPVNDVQHSTQWLNFLDPISLAKVVCGMVATTVAYNNDTLFGLPQSAQLTLGSLGILAISDSLFTLDVND